MGREGEEKGLEFLFAFFVVFLLFVSLFVIQVYYSTGAAQ